jgi:hypothetical protein
MKKQAAGKQIAPGQSMRFLFMRCYLGVLARELAVIWTPAD